MDRELSTVTRTFTFAGLPVGDGLGQVSVVAFLAVVAVASGSVVSAVEADSSALPPRQFVQLHVETAPSSVEVAVTGCGRNRRVVKLWERDFGSCRVFYAQQKTLILCILKISHPVGVLSEVFMIQTVLFHLIIWTKMFFEEAISKYYCSLT